MLRNVRNLLRMTRAKYGLRIQRSTYGNTAERLMYWNENTTDIKTHVICSVV